MGLIGGTVPMISSYIVKNHEADIGYLGLYIASICFFASISVLFVYLKQRANQTVELVEKIILG
jgi:hypothetical protein